ncbi:Alpha-L-rhamnosidase [Streptomyces atroolivaceus]
MQRTFPSWGYQIDRGAADGSFQDAGRTQNSFNRYAYGSEGRFGSAYGRVATRWRKDADGFALRAVLPANTTAEVWVPGGDRRSAGRCPAAFQRLDVGGGAVSTMGSGTHHFAASD